MWTDGSCVQYASGIGVYFGPNHILNISRSLKPPHNSSLAEITAAQEGLKNLYNWPSYKYYCYFKNNYSIFSSIFLLKKQAKYKIMTFFFKLHF